MSLYAIGDLHLHFQSVLKAPGQLKSPLWKDHEKRFKEYCSEIVKEEDTLVLVGDHSWGRNLKECEKDFQYIKELPGRKILTRGNHDMFWDASKTGKLNELFKPELTFLQDGYEAYEDYVLIASKGFTFEGPFYLNEKREITGFDEEAFRHAEKLVDREVRRLRRSFEKATADGYRKFIMFLHYPPTNILEESSPFTKLAREYRVSKLIYAHCHGESRFHDSIIGEYEGTDYRLVSGDFLRWIPMKILN